MFSYETYLGQSNKAIIIVNRDNTVVFANARALALLNSAPDAVLEKNFFDLANIGREMLVLGGSRKLPDGHVIYCKDIADSGIEAVMMHQIKTPLSTMKWTLELLGDDPDLRPESKKMLNEIYYANQYAISLVNNWLQFARIESGNVVVDRKPTDAQKLVSNLLAMLKPQADQKNQRLIVKLNDLPEQLICDATLFSHTFLNLVDNAVTYGNEATDIIIAGKLNNNDRTYQFSITDKGIPISLMDKEKLFTKFWRSNAARAVKASGNGIGLYVAKAAAEANGGRIWFESDASGTTTFYFNVLY